MTKILKNMQGLQDLQKWVKKIHIQSRYIICWHDTKQDIFVYIVCRIVSFSKINQNSQKLENYQVP